MLCPTLPFHLEGVLSIVKEMGKSMPPLRFLFARLLAYGSQGFLPMPSEWLCS